MEWFCYYSFVRVKGFGIEVKTWLKTGWREDNLCFGVGMEKGVERWSGVKWSGGKSFIYDWKAKFCYFPSYFYEIQQFYANLILKINLKYLCSLFSCLIVKFNANF